MSEEQPQNSKPQPKGKPFQPGKSGNPGGRPKAVKDLLEKARGMSPAALKVLNDALKDGDSRVRIAAAKEILDRGLGKAVQPLSGHDGGPVVVQILKYSEADLAE